MSFLLVVKDCMDYWNVCKSSTREPLYFFGLTSVYDNQGYEMHHLRPSAFFCLFSLDMDPVQVQQGIRFPHCQIWIIVMLLLTSLQCFLYTVEHKCSLCMDSCWIYGFSVFFFSIHGCYGLYGPTAS